MAVLLSMNDQTYQRLVNTLRQLKTKTKSLEEENESLKSTLTSQLQKKALLQQKLASLKEVSLSGKSKESENAILTMTIKDLKEEHQANAIKLNELNQTLQKTITYLCEERKKRREAEAATAKMIEQIKNLTMIANQLKGDPEQIKKSELLNRKIMEKRDHWKTTKRDLSEKLKLLQEKRDQALESARNSQIEIDMRVNLIDQLNSEVNSKNQTISKLEDEIQLATDDFEKLQNALDEKQKEIQQLAEKEQNLKEEISKGKKSLNTLKLRYKKESEEHSQCKMQLQQLREDLQRKLEKKKADSERELSEKTSILEQEVEEKDLEIKKLKQQLEEAKERKEKESTRLKILEEERQKEKDAFLLAKKQFESKFQAMQVTIGSISNLPLSANES